MMATTGCSTGYMVDSKTVKFGISMPKALHPCCCMIALTVHS